MNAPEKFHRRFERCLIVTRDAKTRTLLREVADPFAEHIRTMTATESGASDYRADLPSDFMVFLSVHRPDLVLVQVDLGHMWPGSALIAMAKCLDIPAFALASRNWPEERSLALERGAEEVVDMYPGFEGELRLQMMKWLGHTPVPAPEPAKKRELAHA